MGSKLLFPFFLSGCRIVEEKERYDKLNDAAYSALKYRVCAANFFIKYAGLAASRIADFVLANDYRIPDYLKAADFLENGNQRLARAIRFVVDSLRVL